MKKVKPFTLALVADIILALLYTLYAGGVGFNVSRSTLTTYSWVHGQDLVLAFLGSATLFTIPLLIWVWFANERTRQERQSTAKEISSGIGEPRRMVSTPHETRNPSAEKRPAYPVETEARQKTSSTQAHGASNRGSLQIACYSPNCLNPVIGQCAGFDIKCGRYYCEVHSSDRLCAECAYVKNESLRIADFSQTAENLTKRSCGDRIGLFFVTLFALAVGAMGAWGVFSYFSSIYRNDNNTTAAMAAVVTFLIIILISYWVYVAFWDNIEKSKANEVDEVKPGFAEFYTKWKAIQQKEHNKRAAAIAGTVAIIVGAAAVGAVSDELNKDAIEPRLRKAVDDELSRRKL